MSQVIDFGSEGREALLAGAHLLASTVRLTLGPGRRSLVIDREDAPPLATNDVALIAHDFSVSHAVEDLGVQVLKSIIESTERSAGDGVTTAVVLADAMLAEGAKLLQLGVDPVGLKRGMEIALDSATEELRLAATPCITLEAVARVAAFTSGDEKVGDLVAQAVASVGKDGMITVESGTAETEEIAITEGLQLDIQLLSPQLESGLSSAEIGNVLVLVCEDDISAARDLQPLLELVSRDGRPLLVVAPGIEADALEAIKMNHNRGLISVVAVKTLETDSNRQQILRDLAVFTGGAVVSEATGQSVRSVDRTTLGEAQTVVASAGKLTVAGGAGKVESVLSRLEDIDQQFAQAGSEQEVEFLAKRKASLSTGTAVIKAYAETSVEMDQRRAQIERALKVTRSAMTSGVISGGGVGLLQCKMALENLDLSSESERVGVNVVARALEEPARQIAFNVGEEPSVVLGRISREGRDHGFDASTGRYVHMRECWMVDSVDVVCSALANAVSGASTLLTSDIAVARNT
jgi:chaperonin GroEL